MTDVSEWYGTTSTSDILLVAAHCPAAPALAEALRRTGATVTEIDGAGFADRAKAHAGLNRDKRANTIVIIALPPAAARTVKSLNDMTDVSEWYGTTSTSDILFVAAHCPAAPALAEALRRTGATVTEIDGAGFADRAKAHAGLNRDKRANTIVIIALPPAAARTVKSLNDMDEAQWVAATDAPLRATLYTLQAARLHFDGKAGAVICVGPDVGLSGAEGCAPLATLAEGQRGFVKSTARQWAAAGVIVNWISVATPLLAPDLAGAPFPELPELGPDAPATGVTPGIDQLASTILYLAGPGAKAHCGASFNLDGGRWMFP